VDVSLRISLSDKSNITFNGKYSGTFPVKTSDQIISQSPQISHDDSHQHLEAPPRLEVAVLIPPPMQTLPQRPPEAEKFSRSAQMVDRLRRDVLYTEKRVRDRLFAAIEVTLAASPRPPILSRLVREAANHARSEAAQEAFAFSNWEIAARAVSNAMLGARAFLAQNGAPLEPGLRAQATAVVSLKDGYRDLTEAFLLEFLIARLGDIGPRDHVALAHALFRQFDTRVPIADLEDRVVLLLATLHDRITLREDGIYSSSYEQAATT
jgi:hypothetical protein